MTIGQFRLRSRGMRALLALAAVSVLTMPVSYTGGREVSHPHAFVQLFFDAARGSTNHHGPGTTHGHVAPLPREFFLVDVPDDTPIVSPTVGSSERVVLVSMSLAAGLLLLLAAHSRIDTIRSRVTGRNDGPDTPPPRWLPVR